MDFASELVCQPPLEVGQAIVSSDAFQAGAAPPAREAEQKVVPRPRTIPPLHAVTGCTEPRTPMMESMIVAGGHLGEAHQADTAGATNGRAGEQGELQSKAPSPPCWRASGAQHAGA